jgi:FAD binding domain
LIRPGDPDYDQARSVWNGAHDRHPALIIRCAGTADVVRAVEFARSEGLEVAVRGGAHSIAGFSTSDGGVVIDTSPMKGIWVDPASRRAVAQPGLTWSEFDHETQAFGLAVTGGLVSSTGIAGFTLGGGNFGVVTSLEYRLHPVGPLVFAGAVFYAGSAAVQVLRGWCDLTASMPDELTTLANILVAAPVPFLPEAVHGQLIVAILGVHAGAASDGAKAAQPLRTLAEPIADLMGPMPYTAMQACSTRCGRREPRTTSPPRCWTGSTTTPSTPCWPSTPPGRHQSMSCTSTTRAAPWPGSPRTQRRLPTAARRTCSTSSPAHPSVPGSSSMPTGPARPTRPWRRGAMAAPT